MEPRETDIEPPGGSVVLVNGPRGTAYQRYFDGLWYKGGSTVGSTWDDALDMRFHLSPV